MHNRVVSVAKLAEADPPDAARALLGATLRANGVGIRIVEVEAYGSDRNGPWPDPAAHSYPGPTRRNAVMFGPAGVLYVYLSYGMHLCVNVTCGPDATSGAVLIRAGEVLEGVDVAARRRPAARRPADLARGPGNVGSALGISLDDYGTELFDPAASVRLELAAECPEWTSGPRVGVSVEAQRPWRFWIPGDPAVSAYRRSPRVTDEPDTERSSA